MSYGMEIVNSDGNVIVDGLYKNFSYYSSGSGTIPGGDTETGRLSINFSTPTSNPPLIAIQPTGTTFVVSLLGYNYNSSTSQYTGFTAYSSTKVDYAATWGTATFNWKAYITNPDTVVSAYGLAVYNPAGQVVFDSGRDYFKIYSVSTDILIDEPTNSDVNSGSSLTVSHPGISNPYYTLTPPRMCARRATGMNSYFAGYVSGVRKVDSTSVKVNWDVVRRGNGLSSFSSPWPQTLLVLK
jgi:hypothetical protein